MDKKFIILYMSCIIIMLLSVLLINNTRWLADEYHHKQQINYFLEDKFTVAPSLTVIPGYHVIIYGIAKLLGVQSDDLWAFRAINAIFLTLCMIPLLWFLTKDIKRVLTIYLFPTLFSFYFLIYTDLMSVFFVVLAYYLLSKKLNTLSGIAILIAITIRQNNIVWLGMLMVIPLVDLFNNVKISKWWMIKWYIIKYYLKQYWMYIVDCLLFLAFVVVNKGVVIYDRAYHPLSIHFMNIWFALFIGFFLFWPLILGKWRDIWALIKRPEGMIIIGLLSYIIIVTYSNTHWYNLLTNIGFVKNDILIWGSTSTLHTIIFAIPCVITFLWLSTSQVNAQTPRINMGYMLAFFSFFVLLDWMVDMRYFMIPLMFFLLLRVEQEKKVEWIWFGYICLLGLLLFLGIIRGTIWW